MIRSIKKAIILSKNVFFKSQTLRVSVLKFSISNEKRFPKIYTKTGDKGTSSTFTGERRPKDDAIFEALGSTDELTCNIGVAREFVPKSCVDIEKQLTEIQCVLQDLASAVATPQTSTKEKQKEKTKFNSEHIQVLEKWIDEHTAKLPPLRNFILPSGGPGSSALHVARAVCRRAERRVVCLVREDEVDEATLRYLNSPLYWVVAERLMAGQNCLRLALLSSNMNRHCQDVPTTNSSVPSLHVPPLPDKEGC